MQGDTGTLETSSMRFNQSKCKWDEVGHLQRSLLSPASTSLWGSVMAVCPSTLSSGCSRTLWSCDRAGSCLVAPMQCWLGCAVLKCSCPLALCLSPSRGFERYHHPTKLPDSTSALFHSCFGSHGRELESQSFDFFNQVPSLILVYFSLLLFVCECLPTATASQMQKHRRLL